MRTRLRPAAVLLAALAALPLLSVRADDDAPAAPADQLRFADRETMTGDFTGFAAGKGLRFRHKECEGELLVRTDHLDTLTLRQAPAAKDAKAPAADWRITLVNGDVLAGRLVSFAPDKLVLDAPWGGKLEVAAAAIASMAPQPVGAGVGLGGPGDWKMEDRGRPFVMAFGNAGGRLAGEVQPAPKAPPATFKDGRLVLPTVGVSRALGMQAESRLDLTLEGSDAFTVELVSEPTPEGKQTSHVFYFGHGMVSVSKTSREPGSMRSESCARFQAPPKEGPTTVSFLADAKGGHLAVAVNGAKVGSLAVPVETVGKRILLRSQGREVRLARLALVPGATDFADAAPGHGDADTALLANGDKVSGTLLGVSGGKASFKTEAATLDLPLARLRAITFSRAHGLTQAADKDTARLHLGEAGDLTLRLAEIKDGRIAGSAAGLGQVSLPLAAAQKIEFNPGARMASRSATDAAANAAAENGAPAGVIQGFVGGNVQVQVFGGGAQALPNIQLKGMPALPPEVLKQLKAQGVPEGAFGAEEEAEEDDEAPRPAPAQPEKKDAPPVGQPL